MIDKLGIEDGDSEVDGAELGMSRPADSKVPVARLLARDGTTRLGR